MGENCTVRSAIDASLPWWETYHHGVGAVRIVFCVLGLGGEFQALVQDTWHRARVYVIHCVHDKMACGNADPGHVRDTFVHLFWPDASSLLMVPCKAWRR